VKLPTTAMQVVTKLGKVPAAVSRAKGLLGTATKIAGAATLWETVTSLVDEGADQLGVGEDAKGILLEPEQVKELLTQVAGESASAVTGAAGSDDDAIDQLRRLAGGAKPSTGGRGFGPLPIVGNPTTTSELMLDFGHEIDTGDDDDSIDLTTLDGKLDAANKIADLAHSIGWSVGALRKYGKIMKSGALLDNAVMDAAEKLY